MFIWHSDLVPVWHAITRVVFKKIKTQFACIMQIIAYIDFIRGVNFLKNVSYRYILGHEFFCRQWQHFKLIFLNVLWNVNL